MIRFRARAALLLALAASPAMGQGQPPLYRWVQYVPGGIEARAITRATECPAAAIDGQPAAMRVRAAPGPDFPIRVCALAIPAGAASAVIAGAPLPLPRPNPERVLLLGDTGCRITTIVNQSCNDPADWPFPARPDAKLALKPDVAIHVGDFHYRESACRPLNRGCAGSPHGDSWAVWEEDFFKPARPLLEATPFVFVRGNHEECERGGKGWSRALDPYPFASASGCLGPGAPFLADFGDPKLIVMDVATADERSVNRRQAARLRADFLAIPALAPAGRVWLTMHRPIRAAGVAIFNFIIGDNRTLAAASKDAIPASVDMILSGHVHTFQALSWGADLPAQIVSGNGGDELHTTAPSDPTGLVINGARVKHGAGSPGVFGFALLERAGASWRLTSRDMEGRTLAVCLASGRELACDRVCGSGGKSC